MVERIGGFGGGPGEFRDPGAAWMGPGGTLVVAAGAGMRLSVFDVSAVPARHVKDIRLESVVEAGGNGCVMHDRIYINAFDGEHAIEVMDLDGMHVAAFGKVPTDSTLPAVLREELRYVGAVGQITCVLEEDALIFLPQWRPVVQVLTTDGDVRAEWALSEYEQYMARQERNGSTRFGPDPVTGEAHRGLGSTWLGQGRFLVQLGKVGDARERAAGPLEHRLFDFDVGEVSRQHEVAPRFPVYRDGVWYGYQNLSFPQVQTWRTERR